MFISSFHLNNYKCFYDTGEVRLNDGYNIIVGKNNVGKTALLQSLSLSFEPIPHRSLSTVPEKGRPTLDTTTLDFTVSLSREEILNILINNGATFSVPVYKQISMSSITSSYFTHKLQDSNSFNCSLKLGGGRVQVDSFLAQVGSGDTQSWFSIEVDRTANELKSKAIENAHGASYNEIIYNAIKTRIYMFVTERINIAKSTFSDDSVLKPDASNLPAVLNSLQGKNPHRFDRINKYLHIIFPEIFEVSVKSVGGEIEIIVWLIDPTKEREDLTLPLSNCGTGIGQVLAMLFVALTSDFPSVIIIDEPQTYLHPGAIVKTFEILDKISNEGVSHQYIIGTHSTTVMNATNVNKMLLVTYKDMEAKISQISRSETDEIGLLLGEIGYRLSDIFGMDRILWVEGKTEELCFPLIVKRLCKKSLSGTEILGLRRTGDLESKWAEKAIEIYQQVAKCSIIAPPILKFILDKESRTQKACDDIKRRSKGLVEFIPVRMFENYLINVLAIKALVNSIEDFGKIPVNESIINDWIKEHKWDESYFSVDLQTIEKNESNWLKNIDGGKFLSKLFSQLSENKIHFNKTEHGETLTKWILDNASDDFQELANFLDKILAQIGS